MNALRSSARAWQVLAPVLVALGCTGCREASAPQPPAQLAAPRLESSPPTVDFGRVPEGAMVTKSFRVVNAGQGDALIERVRPSCGCTTVRVTRCGPQGAGVANRLEMPFPPGAEFDVEVTIDTTKRLGEQEFLTRVYSNDPAGALRLTAKGIVEPLFEVEPTTLDLGTLAREDGGAAQASVRRHDGAAFLLTCRVPMPESGMPPSGVPDSDVIIELRPHEPDADGRACAWTVAARVPPGTRAGVKRCAVELFDASTEGVHVNVQGRPPGRQLLVLAWVAGSLELSPDRLMLGPLARGATVCREVELKGRAAVPVPAAATARVVELLPRAVEEGGDVVIAIDRVAGAPARWQIRFTRSDDTGRGGPQGLFWGRVQLAVDGEEGEEVELSFSGLLVEHG